MPVTAAETVDAVVWPRGPTNTAIQMFSVRSALSRNGQPPYSGNEEAQP